MSLTYGSLFAGYGGLEMGVSSVLGGELAWYAEFDKAPSAIMAHHHPGVTNYGDVTKVNWASVPKVDVITGGSPCQDLSHAGKRAGMKAGTRSGLWASMCDAIEIIRPRLVVWENVRGALSAPADSAVEPCPICVGDGGRVSLRALGRVLGDLAELGYDAWWYGLRAADVGAAHGRFRIFLFATPTDAELLGWGEGADHWTGSGTAPSEGQAGRAAGHRLLGTDGAPDSLTLLPTPAVNDMGAAYTPETWDAWTQRMKDAHGNGNGHGKSLNIEALRLTPETQGAEPVRGLLGPLFKTPTSQLAVNGGSQHPDKRKGGGHGPTLADEVEHLLPTPRATDGTKGGPNQRGSSGDLMLPSAVTHLFPTPSVADGLGGHLTRSGDRSNELLLPGVAKHVEQDWREYESAIRRQEAAFGRRAPLPTEPGRNGQPRLSPAFVEWLMALPAGHVTGVPGISRNDQLKALGNGVVPPQAAAAARAWLHDSREVAA